MTMKTTLAALLTAMLSSPLMAATCNVDLEGNDAMRDLAQRMAEASDVMSPNYDPSKAVDLQMEALELAA